MTVVPLALLILSPLSSAFQAPLRPTTPHLQQHLSSDPRSETHTTTLDNNTPPPTIDEKRLEAKRSLLGLIGTPSTSYTDPVLTCPSTGAPLTVTAKSSPIIDSSTRRSPTKLTFSTPTTSYSGRSDGYYDLLLGSDGDGSSSSASATTERIVTGFRAFLPPSLRSIFASEEEYVPMRDLFTSPAVSFAYERGWRQGFAAAGFPGVEKEYELVREYFLPCTVGVKRSTVVDMSCATGLMTRRLAASNDYARVLGCDYSPSMLTEARRRIRSDLSLSNVELVRLDVVQIPMKESSIDALHAGAAMHCWPDVDGGLSEIYRVLKPGGRYFASTFLSSYFATLQIGEGENMKPTQQAFNYFTSTDEIRGMCIKAGFEEDKVDVEVLGTACVIIRCEK